MALEKIKDVKNDENEIEVIVEPSENSVMGGRNGSLLC